MHTRLHSIFLKILGLCANPRSTSCPQALAFQVQPLFVRCTSTVLAKRTILAKSAAKSAAKSGTAAGRKYEFSALPLAR